MGARLVAGFLLILLAAGCFVLWLGVPSAGMWLAGEISDTKTLHLPIAFALIVVGMIAWAAGLAWIDRLYLRVTGGEIVESRGVGIRRQGPLEPMLIGTLLLAAVAFTAWFFLLAENPNIAGW